MPDGPFKAMGRDRDSDRPKPWMSVHRLQATTCDTCGRLLFAGYWPFCKGNPEDHER